MVDSAGLLLVILLLGHLLVLLRAPEQAREEAHLIIRPQRLQEAD
jgi:hypothetical protein